MGERTDDLEDLLSEDADWIYRAVPKESHEVADVAATGEVAAPRPDRRSEYWRRMHSHGDTDTAYTSWTTEPSVARDAAESAADGSSLSGVIVVLRVSVTAVAQAGNAVYRGREDEMEWLIEGTVERVEFDD